MDQKSVQRKVTEGNARLEKERIRLEKRRRKKLSAQKKRRDKRTAKRQKLKDQHNAAFQGVHNEFQRRLEKKKNEKKKENEKENVSVNEDENKNENDKANENVKANENENDTPSQNNALSGGLHNFFEKHIKNKVVDVGDTGSVNANDSETKVENINDHTTENEDGKVNDNRNENTDSLANALENGVSEKEVDPLDDASKLNNSTRSSEAEDEDVLALEKKTKDPSTAHESVSLDDQVDRGPIPPNRNALIDINDELNVIRDEVSGTINKSLPADAAGAILSNPQMGDLAIPQQSDSEPQRPYL